MEIFFIVTGLIAGLLGGWLLAGSRNSGKIQDFIVSLASANAPL
jgi:uncharacterized membrane protein YeaQ/YmgE (transglycosylase-associated protein family)